MAIAGHAWLTLDHQAKCNGNAEKGGANTRAGIALIRCLVHGTVANSGFAALRSVCRSLQFSVYGIELDGCSGHCESCPDVEKNLAISRSVEQARRIRVDGCCRSS